jgi:NAD-dependent deacetylase
MNISKKVYQLIDNAKYIAVLTGAGISAESGVQTFRGNDGLWSKFKPEQLAKMDAFAANPMLVWKWYQYRCDLLNNANPNPGHYALVE